MASRTRNTSSAGSSPLTRGKPGAHDGGERVPRLIPAHAGKTVRLWAARGERGAHPRSRGENRRSVRARRRPDGSSPLTRGKPRQGSVRPYGLGLIPAHAGKTRAARGLVSDQAAHPRSRGENGPAGRNAGARAGSSPLTRGKLENHSHSPGYRRLIPAHAGKTETAPLRAIRCTAHPRSRGENTDANDARNCNIGSSPLTRGKRDHSAHLQDVPRLIPAHAGKTFRWVLILGLLAAHPRSRGENFINFPDAADAAGSSPLTRGKHPSRHHDPPGHWLIPAHAGKTS